ncbi:histidine phosphatase family protein [Hymenobacter sp. J193]|uniref:histidine phosphatase family protein n=1 Tax=Hymenobacter sp. J193 TaxID=2898429 RepID=UPI002150BEA1|nr:histidine phosphatase family protein [Hymenobacter sp. J193]MCR5886270.1 histidine phosphatase family protein [Hymenobacter sp. J193]
MLPKNVLTLLTGLLLAGCATTQTILPPAAAPTVVYIVRHGEKDLTPGLADPPLTPAGQQRAQALHDTLAARGIKAVFSTNTSRTKNTVQPLATQLKLPVQLYDAKQLPALATRIRREYGGQRVVVAGHSNTILETAEALGARRPVPTIGDDEYNYLLQVTVPADTTQAPSAVARRYGADRP